MMRCWFILKACTVQGPLVFGLYCHYHALICHLSAAQSTFDLSDISVLLTFTTLSPRDIVYNVERSWKISDRKLQSAFGGVKANIMWVCRWNWLNCSLTEQHLQPIHRREDQTSFHAAASEKKHSQRWGTSQERRQDVKENTWLIASLLTTFRTDVWNCLSRK